MKNVISILTLATTFLLPIPRQEIEVQAQLASMPGSYLVAANTKNVKKLPAKKQVKTGRKAPVARAAAKPNPVIKKATPYVTPNYERVAEKQASQEVSQEINNAMVLAKQGKYQEASLRLFQMSRSPKFSDQRMQVRYLLGLTLFEMKLYQVAAFQFISVIRDGSSKYVRQSLEKLSIAADKLNDDTMLNYAMSKVRLEEFPKTHQDMLRFRIGEIQMKSRLFEQAAKTLAGVAPGSEWFAKAKYLEGLANSERGAYNEALQNFSDLVNSESSKGVANPNRVGGLMGMARVYYQQSHKMPQDQEKHWDKAIEIYKQIPRDSEMWHDQLFEISWAQMRAAQFRDVLSNFHSLHSAYYEDFYIPESILLRGIVYLYICQYDEMEKTLDLFDRIYKPVLSDLTSFLKSYSKPMTYYEEIASQQDNIDELKANSSSRRKFQIPFLVARHVMQEGDYSRVRSYINQIRVEWNEIDQTTDAWKKSELGQYSKKLLQGRMSSAKKVAGKYIRDHIIDIRKELADLFEQHGFARYEMMNGRKEQLKKKIAGKTLEKKQLDEDEDRNFYIQNGYEYWPFSGEYWLDEIGNYHYLGTQKCD